MADITHAEIDESAAYTAVRPGTPADFSYVLECLKVAITTSEYYSDVYKAHELARLNRSFLAAIHAADPYHVAICLKDGKPAGFILTGPEFGNLWLYWAYIEPHARRSTISLTSMRELIHQFDNGRFHKMSTYTRPGNAAPAAVIRRMGFEQIALLEKHIFGEDYILFERKLHKTLPGYDHGAPFGRMAAIKRLLKRLLGRAGS